VDFQHQCGLSLHPLISEILGLQVFSPFSPLSGSSYLLPASTGKPMLTMLNHCGPGEVYSAVIRYFGGIKLGKGGLIRAYTGSVQQALALLDTVAVQPMLHFRLDLDYNLLALLESLLEQIGTHSIERSFAEGLGLDLLIPQSGSDQLQKQIVRISGAALRLEPQNDP
jgi:putative IMPACT (imprinted ancient) family translation regulator